MKAFIYKAAYFLTMGWLLGSCTCDIQPTRPSSPYIYYRNNKGQDLLDPSTVGYFGQNGLIISYTNPDGTPGSQYLNVYKLPFLSSSSSVSYLPDGHYVTIDPFGIDYKGNSGIVTGNTCIVYIQLSALDTDTLTFD